MKDRWDRLAGGLLLWWAVILHRTVAKREQWLHWQAKRNVYLCRAERKGLSPEEIAKRMHLQVSTVKVKIRNGKKVEREGIKAVEEDAL